MGEQLRPCLYCGTNEHIEVTEDCCKCTKCGVWTTCVRDWNVRSRIHVQTPVGLVLFYFGSSSDGDTSHWQQEYGQPDPKETAEWVNRWKAALEDMEADIRTYSEAELAEYTKGIADQLKSVSEDGDMSEAPERIWVQPWSNGAVGDCWHNATTETERPWEFNEYTRSDLSQALIAAKLREAADWFETYWRPEKFGQEIAKDILTLIDTDAQAALDAVRAEERERIVNMVDAMFVGGVIEEVKAAIREAGHE
jgi:hypothetical protein